jgi:hypothetical protein
MADAHANFAYSTVATAPSPASAATSLVVQSGEGADFPTPPFNATVWPYGAQPDVDTAEIVRVTAIAGDTFTITRGPQTGDPGGINRSIIVGDQIAATVTVKTLTDVENYIGIGSTYIEPPAAYTTLGNDTVVLHDPAGLQLDSGITVTLSSGTSMVLDPYDWPMTGRTTAVIDSLTIGPNESVVLADIAIIEAGGSCTINDPSGVATLAIL